MGARILKFIVRSAKVLFSSFFHILLVFFHKKPGIGTYFCGGVTDRFYQGNFLAAVRRLTI
jgi:hypothetical protein